MFSFQISILSMLDLKTA